MSKITFNTGRLYTAEGQVITAELHDDRVLFKDHSRLICGEVVEPYPRPLTSLDHFVRWVMHRYDSNQYRMSVDAIGLDRAETVEKVRI